VQRIVHLIVCLGPGHTRSTTPGKVDLFSLSFLYITNQIHLHADHATPSGESDSSYGDQLSDGQCTIMSAHSGGMHVY
jgi:hypothetical protein